MNRTRILVLLTVVFCLWGFCASAAGRTTRDLVFEDDAPSGEQADGANATDTRVSGAQTVSMGVKTTILLTRDGKTSTVLPSHVFKSGDSLKLVFTPSINGYVYWMAKGSSGEYSMLFPSAKAGTDNKVTRNNEYTIPAKGVFRFDNKAGTEELLCILSEEKLPDIEKALESEARDSTSFAQVATLERQNAEKRTTRDLVFEDDDSDDVNTKQQSAAKGEPFVAHYELTHE